MSQSKKLAPDAPKVTAPPRETIAIAHGPNEHGHDHMATTAQNPELAEERTRKAAAVKDESVDYPPTGEEE